MHAIPEEFESSVSLVEEIKRIRMRDIEDWSPPRFQIISTVQPYMKYVSSHLYCLFLPYIDNLDEWTLIEIFFF